MIKMKKFISIIIVLAVVGVGFYFLSKVFQGEEIDKVDFEASPLDFSVSPQQEEEEPAVPNTEKITFDQLQAEILQQGTGQTAKNGDQLIVDYAGFLEDGTKFDSSLDRGQPFGFTLGAGQVIQGWDLGVVGMKVGEIRRLYIPSEFGYGTTGTPGGPIPPNANLVFEVQLLEISQ